jgi:DNA invertase Pin-like site-specific DNA recombinase
MTLDPQSRRERAALAKVSGAAIPRTFGYCRVSTDEQSANGQSLAVQESQLHGWAQMTGRALDRVFVEAGVSGAVPFSKRAEGSKLWSELRKGDCLAATKLDRFTRNLLDCLQVSQELQRRGVALFLLDVGANDAVTGNGQSKLFLSMLGAFAEFERDRIGERIKATKRAQKARGEYLGGAPRFGYRLTGKPGDKNRKLAPDPEQQSSLYAIYRLADEGVSPWRISEILLNVDGTRLSHMGVRKVLKRRAEEPTGRFADRMRAERVAQETSG